MPEPREMTTTEITDARFSAGVYTVRNAFQTLLDHAETAGHDVRGPFADFSEGLDLLKRAYEEAIEERDANKMYADEFVDSLNGGGMD
jgi:hypothetical protein